MPESQCMSQLKRANEIYLQKSFSLVPLLVSYRIFTNQMQPTFLLLYKTNIEVTFVLFVLKNP